MQWTILEHDFFFGCIHGVRVVEPRRTCPHSVHILLKGAAIAWQWRRVALHEGYEGCARRTPAVENAHLRSAVVGGQWPQLRKYLSARTLSPPCALYGSEENSLVHRHFRCPESQGHAKAHSTRQPNQGSCGSMSHLQRERCCWRPVDTRQGALPFEIRWQGDRSFITGAVYGDPRPVRCPLGACG